MDGCVKDMYINSIEAYISFTHKKCCDISSKRNISLDSNPSILNSKYNVKQILVILILDILKLRSIGQNGN